MVCANSIRRIVHAFAWPYIYFSRSDTMHSLSQISVLQIQCDSNKHQFAIKAGSFCHSLIQFDKTKIWSFLAPQFSHIFILFRSFGPFCSIRERLIGINKFIDFHSNEIWHWRKKNKLFLCSLSHVRPLIFVVNTSVLFYYRMESFF